MGMVAVGWARRENRSDLYARGWTSHRPTPSGGEESKDQPGLRLNSPGLSVFPDHLPTFLAVTRVPLRVISTCPQCTTYLLPPGLGPRRA